MRSYLKQNGLKVMPIGANLSSLPLWDHHNAISVNGRGRRTLSVGQPVLPAFNFAYLPAGPPPRS